MNYDQLKLAALESACADIEGMYCSSVPAIGFEQELVKDGFMEPAGNASAGLINEYFFRITPKGREFVKQQVPPAEW